MIYHNRKCHRRRSIRLKGYDYSQPGAYFVTCCTHDRDLLFGDVVDGHMILNGLGAIVQHAWEDLPNHYPHVDLDAFVIMPNHAHGIIMLTDEPVGAVSNPPLRSRAIDLSVPTLPNPPLLRSGMGFPKSCVR